MFYAVFAQQVLCQALRVHTGKLVFAQLTDLIHPEQFRRCVRRYNGDYKVKTFSCWNQFLCMAFGQLTFRESLRDVETCLSSRQDQLYHLGIRGEVSHSTLADANRERDWRIYYDLAQLLIRRARSRSEEHTSELQSQSNLVCRLLLEKKKKLMNGSPVSPPRTTLARTVG